MKTIDSVAIIELISFGYAPNPERQNRNSDGLYVYTTVTVSCFDACGLFAHSSSLEVINIITSYNLLFYYMCIICSKIYSENLNNTYTCFDTSQQTDISYIVQKTSDVFFLIAIET